MNGINLDIYFNLRLELRNKKLGTVNCCCRFSDRSASLSLVVVSEKRELAKTVSLVCSFLQSFVLLRVIGENHILHKEAWPYIQLRSNF